MRCRSCCCSWNYCSSLWKYLLSTASFQVNMVPKEYRKIRYLSGKSHMISHAINSDYSSRYSQLLISKMNCKLVSTEITEYKLFYQRELVRFSSRPTITHQWTQQFKNNNVILQFYGKYRNYYIMW